MEPLSLREAATCMGASNTETFGDDGIVSGVCTNSREAQPGFLFFALPGEKTDGHNFIEDAVARGAIAVVAHPVNSGHGQLLVQDPLIALGELAGYYRSRFKLRVIGVTGSIGKTSTRSMIGHILSSLFPIIESEKNYNNEIGVPVTLLRITAEHQAAVIEMGMRASGEICVLAQIARPEIGVITSIGVAHIEMLGSQEAIARAKSELFQELPAGGCAIMPGDLPYLELIKSQVPSGVRIVTTGTDGDFTLSDLTVSPTGRCSFEITDQSRAQHATFEIMAPGTHHAGNALLAVAAAAQIGISVSDCAEPLRSWQGASGRSNLIHGENGITVLDDCYNAGPESMKAALSTLASLPAPRTAILGDMRELGDYAPKLHEEVGVFAASLDLRQLISVGSLAQRISDTTTANDLNNRIQIKHFASTEECLVQVRELVTPGESVLVKGSRALTMERIVDALTGRQTADSHG